MPNLDLSDRRFLLSAAPSERHPMPSSIRVQKASARNKNKGQKWGKGVSNAGAMRCDANLFRSTDGSDCAHLRHKHS